MKGSKVTNGSTSGRRRRARPTRPQVPPPVQPQVTGGGESKTVRLASGGTLTLAATTAFLSLSQSDRAFVFELIDKLIEYETKNPVAEREPEGDRQDDEQDDEQ